MRLKDCVVLRNEKTEEQCEYYIALENIKSWDASFAPTDGVTEGTNNRCKSGDILFGKLRPYLAKVYIPENNGICSTEFLVMTAKPQFLNRYILYFLLSNTVIDYLQHQVAGVKMPRTNWETVAALEMPRISSESGRETLPDFVQQRRIVEYLDLHCAAIDRKVALLEQKRTAYGKLKRALINETVTRGLDKNAELVDSGVDWVGKVPAGWNLKRVKDIAMPLQYGASEVGLEYDPDLPRYIRITDITQGGELREDGAQSLSEEVARPYLLREGDILLARSGATVGKAFVYRAHYGRSAYAGYMIRCRVIPACAEFRFVYNWMLSSFYQFWRQRTISQATIQNIGADKYANLTVPMPPPVEQRAIADYLDRKCAAIDAAVENVTRQIELYRKLKRSLIDEVVTGRRKVA